MPKLSKSVPKYRKHRASGQAVVTLDGIDFYLGPHGSATSVAEYDRMIGEWLANGRRLPKQEQAAIKVVELCWLYWSECKTYYVKNGEPTHEQAGVKAALRPIKKMYGDIPVTEFGPLSLEAVREQMIRSGNSRRYINQNIGRIKRMFRWGVSKQIVPVEIYQALATLAGLKK